MGRMFESTDDRVLQIVDGLYARGVDLFAEGGEIHYRSSLAAIVTDDDRVDLDENKVGLIAFLLIHKQGRLDNVIPFPAPRDGRETDEAG